MNMPVETRSRLGASLFETATNERDSVREELNQYAEVIFQIQDALLGGTEEEPLASIVSDVRALVSERDQLRAERGQS